MMNSMKSKKINGYVPEIWLWFSLDMLDMLL